MHFRYTAVKTFVGCLLLRILHMPPFLCLCPAVLHSFQTGHTLWGLAVFCVVFGAHNELSSQRAHLQYRLVYSRRPL